MNFFITVDSPTSSPLPPPQLVGPTESDSKGQLFNSTYSECNQKRRRITLTPTLLKQQQQPSAVHRKIIRFDASKFCSAPSVSVEARRAPSTLSSRRMLSVNSCPVVTVPSPRNANRRIMTLRRRRNQNGLVARSAQLKNVSHYPPKHQPQVLSSSHEENLPPLSNRYLDVGFQQLMHETKPAAANAATRKRMFSELSDHLSPHGTTVAKTKDRARVHRKTKRQAYGGSFCDSVDTIEDVQWSECTPISVSSGSSSSCQASPVDIDDFRSIHTTASSMNTFDR